MIVPLLALVQKAIHISMKFNKGRRYPGKHA